MEFTKQYCKPSELTKLFKLACNQKVEIFVSQSNSVFKSNFKGCFKIVEVNSDRLSLKIKSLDSFSPDLDQPLDGSFILEEGVIEFTTSFYPYLEKENCLKIKYPESAQVINRRTYQRFSVPDYTVLSFYNDDYSVSLKASIIDISKFGVGVFIGKEYEGVVNKLDSLTLKRIGKYILPCDIHGKIVYRFNLSGPSEEAEYIKLGIILEDALNCTIILNNLS